MTMIWRRALTARASTHTLVTEQKKQKQKALCVYTYKAFLSFKRHKQLAMKTFELPRTQKLSAFPWFMPEGGQNSALCNVSTH